MLGITLKRSFYVMVLAALMLPILAACGNAGPQAGTTTATATTQPVGKVVKTEKGEYRDITPDELKVMMDNKDFVHVDVHVPNEGKLPQIDARIPYDQITNQLDKLPADKSAKIVLTCKSGGMSAEAAGKLADLGYTNVYNLAGGFVAWKAQGYEFTPEP